METGNGSFDHLYTFNEVAFIYMLDTSTLRKMISKGKLIEDKDVKKFGNTWIMTEQSMIKHFGYMPFKYYLENRKAEYLFKTGKINYKEKFEMENDLGLF